MKFVVAVIIGSLLLGVLPLLQFAYSQEATFEFDSYIWKVLWFTLKQALLSSVISTVLGMLLARSLSRVTFFGKSYFVNLLTLPQAMPAIVVVLAITSIFGASGIFAKWFNVYGLTGILIAHVFFNMPLATRLFGEALQNIPTENFRLAEQLNFSNIALFRHVEWPAIKRELPRIFALIFLLCAASFVVVLTLGGPSATTLEVAIYQSLRQDFDVPRALTLSILQISVCAILVLVIGKSVLPYSVVNSYKTESNLASNQTRKFDLLVIALGASLIVPPMVSLIFSGLTYLNFNAQAIWTSFAFASLSTVMCLSLAWFLAQNQSVISQVTTLSALIGPPAVIATGWFLILKDFDSRILVVLSITALNALMALPFTVATLAPAFTKLTIQHHQLCMQLGLKGWLRFKLIDLPLLRRPLIQAALLTFIMALGDLTAITLLGNQGFITLPSLIHAQMGNYRGNDAAGTALILAVLCFLLTHLTKKFGTAHD